MSSQSASKARPTARLRRPTERAQYDVENQDQKASRQLLQTEKLAKSKDKRVRMDKKVAERAAYQNRENEDPAGSPQNEMSGSDPIFSSKVVSAPAISRLSLVSRKSVVPPVPAMSSAPAISRLSLVSRKSVIPPVPVMSATASGSSKSTKRNTLTPEGAAELLRMRDIVLAQSSKVPAAQQSMAKDKRASAPASRSPSPSDGELMDDAISQLPGMDLDDPSDFFRLCEKESHAVTNPGRATNNESNQYDDDDDKSEEDTSSSPVPSKKRRHSEVNHSDNEDSNRQHVRKAMKTQQSTGKPKAADYEPAVRTVFGVAWALYRGTLLNQGAMADRMMEITWAKKAWTDACKKCETNFAYDAEIIKMITSRGTHLRGEVKTKVRPYIADALGFESSAKQHIIDRNITLARELKKDFNYVYKKWGPEGNSGLYAAKIIQKGVNAMWFKDKKDEGVLYPEFYKPFPEVGLALLLTAIECCIDEWSTGAQVTKKFAVDDYQDVYDEHLNSLNEFDEATHDQGLLPKLLSRLHDNGRVHAKADPLGQDTGRSMKASAFAAAIDEYNNQKGGNFSDSEDNEDE